MTHLLCDSDRIAYTFGGLKDEEGAPQCWEILRSRIDDNINLHVLATRATSFELVLTSDDKSNFRFGTATVQPYKGNRLTEKPFWYTTIRSYLVDTYGATVVYGKEADDYLASKQSKDTIISSVDKDLDQVVGKRFNELHPERGVYEITEVAAQRAFYLSLCCGDACDNIFTIHGIGPASALCKRIHTLHESYHMYLAVKAEYVKRYRAYWKLYMYEAAQLLWLLRTDNTKEIIEIFEGYEKLDAGRTEEECEL